MKAQKLCFNVLIAHLVFYIMYWDTTDMITKYCSLNIRLSVTVAFPYGSVKCIFPAALLPKFHSVFCLHGVMVLISRSIFHETNRLCG